MLMDARFGVERGRQEEEMTEVGTTWERTELFELPPRKRFKVMEQQRRKEVQEEVPTVLDPHCNDITNVMPLHRLSPTKLTSQGFLVVEKQKYRLQQQKLQENLIPAMPSRPMAVKRKEAPALPLPTPPPTKLKFQEETAHSLASSAFKNWGSRSPKKIFKPRFCPVFPGPRPNQDEHESLRVPSSVEHPKTWTMPKGTTCSVNKAQEDVEMIMCKAPVLSLDMRLDSCSSGKDVIALTSTTSSAPIEALDLNVAAEVDRGIQITNDDNRVAASQIIEVGTMAAMVPMEEGATIEVQDVKDASADRGSSETLDVIHADVGSHAPLENRPVIEAAYADAAQVDDDEDIVENNQQVDGPTLQTPADETAFTGAEESKVVEVKQVEPEADLEKATLALPEVRPSAPLAAGSSISALVEIHTNFDTPNISKVTKDVPAAAICEGGDAVVNLLEQAADEAYSARKDEEQAAPVVVDAAEEQDVKETMPTSTLRDSLVITKEQDEKETDLKQVNLLAKIEERAEKLFKRMFEREGYSECYNDEDNTDISSSQLFFAPNGVDHLNSLVIDMETDVVSPLNFRDLDEASTQKPKNGDGRGVHVFSIDDDQFLDEDHQIELERPIDYVSSKLCKEMTSEMPESSSRAFEGHEDSDFSEDHENDGPISEQVSARSQEIVCKSSKEDSDWDMEMEIPNFGFRKRSGMTQRVKAPGRWSQSSEAKATIVDEEVDEEADENEGACDVCRSADAKPSDPIVLCDGCDIPVHADCYGNPLSHEIPEGDWFCAQCQSKRPDSRNCCLCPRSGGVMKVTTDGNWAHLSCAVFVPEVNPSHVLTFCFTLLISCFKFGVLLRISEVVVLLFYLQCF